MGLQVALGLRVKELEVYGDSALIISQIHNRLKIKEEKLLPYHEYLQKLASKFGKKLGYMKLGYMNSRRPSKPNLPCVPKPFKLLTPTRLRRTFVFSNLPNSTITHSINQYQLVSS